MKQSNALLASAISLVFCSSPLYADFTMSGLVEAEIYSTDSDANGDSSDIVIPTVELAIAATLNDKVDVSIILLAEDIGTADETEVLVDEAIINMAVANGTLTVGDTGVSFGAYETSVIADPLTLTLGETAEIVVSYSVENDFGVTFTGYVFNGSVDENGDDEINDMGLSVSLGRDNWAFGLDYISNLGDSDELEAVAAGDDVAGLAVHGSFVKDNLTFIFEHVTALDKFTAGVANGEEPSATHLELDVDLGDDQVLAISISSSDDAEGLGLFAENQIAIAYGATILDSVGMTIEALNSEGYDGNDDTTLTLQLAVEF